MVWNTPVSGHNINKIMDNVSKVYLCNDFLGESEPTFHKKLIKIAL
jgi:hypothetical protein